MKVVDASVLLPALTDQGDDSRRAAQLLGGDSAAPELIDLEIMQALRRQVRAGAIGNDQADSARLELALLPLARIPHLFLLERIWEHRDNLSAYDAAYVALAEEMEAILFTADRKLASAPGIHCDVELVA